MRTVILRCVLVAAVGASCSEMPPAERIGREVVSLWGTPCDKPASTNRVEMITFASPHDCATRANQLQVIPALAKKAGILETTLVVGAENPMVARRAVEMMTGLEYLHICAASVNPPLLDRTPFSVIVVDGIVVHTEVSSLLSVADKARLVENAKRYAQ